MELVEGATLLDHITSHQEKGTLPGKCGWMVSVGGKGGSCASPRPGLPGSPGPFPPTRAYPCDTPCAAIPALPPPHMLPPAAPHQPIINN
eukprot:scaffold9996_cov86-Isochrysis_galbana.AAC.1